MKKFLGTFIFLAKALEEKIDKEAKPLENKTYPK